MSGPMRLILALFLLAAAAHAEDAVGRLNAAGYRTTEMCSGALVAPDRVVTAAHCVLDPRDGYAKRIADMVFVAGWDGARHVGASKVAEVAVHPGAFRDGQFDIAFDVAVLTLATPLDSARLPLGSAAPAGPLTILGYPRSRPHRLRVQTDCAGRAQGALWRLDCPVEKGQSGGPVLFGDGPARRIVAIIVASTDDAAFAVPVDPWLRRHVP